MNNTTIQISETLTGSMEELRITTAVLGILVYGIGFIGNFFSLLLFIQKELRQMSTGLIFLLLNIFSTVHLLSLIVEFLDSIFQIQVIANVRFRCQFILWAQNASRTICSFLAATISIDRYIRSEYPMKSRIWCTTKNVMKLFILYCLFSVTFYAVFFHPLNVFDSQQQCSFPYQSTFRLFVLSVLPPVRFLFICVIPVVVMVVCGGQMVYNIRRAKRRIAPQGIMPDAGIATIIPAPSKGNNMIEGARKDKVKIDDMLLVMVLVNVVAYIITQTPFSIYTLYYGYETSNDYTIYALFRAFLLMWSSVYFGIGFYLFFITSAHFRNQFVTQIKGLCTRYRIPPRQRRM